jgi:hypothetical protein
MNEEEIFRFIEKVNQKQSTTLTVKELTVVVTDVGLFLSLLIQQLHKLTGQYAQIY